MSKKLSLRDMQRMQEMRDRRELQKQRQLKDTVYNLIKEEQKFVKRPHKRISPPKHLQRMDNFTATRTTNMKIEEFDATDGNWQERIPEVVSSMEDVETNLNQSI